MTTTTPLQVRPTVATWFELPADDFERAIAFYERILATTLRRQEMLGERLAVFPYERPGISGAVVDRPGQTGAGGSVVYLNADGRLDAALAEAAAAGGAVLIGRTSLGGDMGDFAVIRDSEGNRVGLHAIF